MIGNLWFEEKHKRKLIAEDIELDKVCDYIIAAEQESHPYYIITYMDESNSFVYDFGSWSKFFRFIPKEVNK